MNTDEESKTILDGIKIDVNIVTEEDKERARINNAREVLESCKLDWNDYNNYKKFLTQFEISKKSQYVEEFKKELLALTVYNQANIDIDLGWSQKFVISIDVRDIDLVPIFDVIIYKMKKKLLEEKFDRMKPMSVRSEYFFDE